MGRASNEAFDALHALFAEGLGEELKRSIVAARAPKTILNADGKRVSNPDYAPLSPQFLNQVRGFLKDNGIDAPGHSARVGGLAAALQDLDMDEELTDRLRN